MIPWTTIEHEDMDAWEVLVFLVSRDTALPVLRALVEDSAPTADELATQLESNISQSTLWGSLERLGKRGFVARNDDGHFEATLLGEYALNIYDTLRNDVGDDGVELFARSESVAPILEALANEPGAPSDLERNSSVKASRTTIYRRLSDLEEQGWIARSSQDEVIKAGLEALEAYQKFAVDMECVIDKSEFLQFFELGPMALEALHGTKIYEGSGGNPNAPTDAFADAVTPEMDYVHGVSPVVVSDYVDSFIPLVRNGADIELVMDSDTLESMRTDFPIGYALASLSDSVSLLVSPEDVSFGIAILSGEEVWLGTYDSNGLHRATLQGSNEELLQWAKEEFESYRSEAYDDPKSFISPFTDFLADEIPFIDSLYALDDSMESQTQTQSLSSGEDESADE